MPYCLVCFIRICGDSIRTEKIFHSPLEIFRLPLKIFSGCYSLGDEAVSPFIHLFVIYMTIMMHHSFIIYLSFIYDAFIYHSFIYLIVFSRNEENISHIFRSMAQRYGARMSIGRQLWKGVQILLNTALIWWIKSSKNMAYFCIVYDRHNKSLAIQRGINKIKIDVNINN